ncbi:MAG TPA: Gfo/Idh/MocA family oxidoreductase [Rhodothermales bacterium]
METSSSKAKTTLDRRTFVGGIAAASAFTILPRHVLGGSGRIAPSDRLNVAQIGCGTQGLRQATVGYVQREDVQITCVCDPNTDSSNYVDWSRYGNRNDVRRLLDDPTWGESDTGIRSGREVARQVIETYYGKKKPSGSYTGVRSYADFRELFEKESDLDAAIIITPDHTHATISLAAMGKGVAPICHKPVSNVLHEVRRTIEAARASSVTSHLLAWGDDADFYRLEAMLKGGVIGTVREVHNWTSRPFWPQGWLDYPAEQPPVPAGFDWDLWLGPEPHRPYHPTYTFALYRGWYAYGGGCFADMGNYSLWNIYRMLDLGAPTSVEARANTVAYLDEFNVSRFKLSEVAYPVAGTLHFTHAPKEGRPGIDLYWYEGGIKPQTPPELRETGESLEGEGMMFVGDAGKILCHFHGNGPRVLGTSTAANAPAIPAPEVEIVDGADEWIRAYKNGGRSRGAFENVEALAEATALGGVAFRVAGKRLLWDSANLRITNDEDANRFVRRTYREGWEIA